MIDLPQEIILLIIDHIITDAVRQNETLDVSIQECLARTKQLLDPISSLSVQCANCVAERWRKRKKRIKREIILTRFLQNHIDQLHSNVPSNKDLYEIVIRDRTSRYHHAFLFVRKWFHGTSFAQYKVFKPYVDPKSVQWEFDPI